MSTKIDANVNGVARERMEEPDEQESPVLVTGFGPFHHHTVNASWVAVQEMEKLGIEHNSRKIPLRIKEIPVAYDVVSSMVPNLYEEVKPRLCVHVGVSPYKVIKIEKFGRNVGYRSADIFGKAPRTTVCVPGGPECISTKFNVDGICETLSKKHFDVTFETSDDAGRYLCDFIYYTSLHHGKAPVVFIHVPGLNEPYSAEQLATALKGIIEALLDQL